MLDLKINWIRKIEIILLILITALIVFTANHSAGAEVVQHDQIKYIVNPYTLVDWESTGYYKANLQTHTTESDGDHRPLEVVKSYQSKNYDILSLTDHNRLTWPWSEYEIDEEGLEMTAVRGVEISDIHHMGSYFNDFTGGKVSEEESLEIIEEKGGLAVFYHPGRYNLGLDWYLDYYQNYSSLVGIEIYNQGNQYKDDWELWDKILAEMEAVNLIWGFANDDLHQLPEHLALGYNIFLLEDNNLENVKKAMRDGQFYIYKPAEQGAEPQLRIENIVIDEAEIKLYVSGDYDKIEWVSYNKEEKESQVVDEGISINLRELPFKTNYVRARIKAESSIIDTQPFGIKYEN